jgi:hypothetical protein
MSGRARRKPDAADPTYPRIMHAAAHLGASYKKVQLLADPATVLPGISDPVCARACGRCHYCLRAKYGPLYWLRGAP